MAVLPHYSPGYPEWDVAEQPRLLELMKRTRKEPFPSRVEVFDSGMLRPKKTLLAVFGLTRHTERLRRLTESCSLRKLLVRPMPVQACAVPASAASLRASQLPVRVAVLDQDAQYSVNRRALQRWAEERLSMTRIAGRLARRHASATREPPAPTWAGRWLSTTP